MNQTQGKEIKPAKEKMTNPSPDLNKFLDENAGLQENFKKFSPAKQREFAECINEAKRAETKQIRLGKKENIKKVLDI